MFARVAAEPSPALAFTLAFRAVRTVVSARRDTRAILAESEVAS